MRLSFLIFAVVATAGVGCDGGIIDPPKPNGIDTLTFAPPTAVADGNSVVTLTIVDTTAPPVDGKVSLLASAGTFLGGTNGTITVSLDTSGRAQAQLKAPASSGSAIVSATAGGITRYFTVPFTASASAPVTKGVLSIGLSDLIVPADSATTVTVTAVVDTQPRPLPYVVTLTTTSGSFLGGGGDSPSTIVVPVDVNGQARAVLRAPNDSATALITATAGSITRDTVIVFAPAAPTGVQLSGDFAVKAGPSNSAAIAATLFRASGLPSPGVTVQFSADTVGGVDGMFGQFSPRSAVTGSSPTVTSRFTAGDTSYRGTVTIRIRAMRAGVAVSDSTIIQVIAP